MQTQSFFSNSLGINDRQVATMIWAEVVHRLVLVQKSKRLCVARCGNGLRARGKAGLGQA